MRRMVSGGSVGRRWHNPDALSGDGVGKCRVCRANCARRSVQETIEVATEFVTNLSFRVAQTTRNLSNVRKSPGELEDPSHSLGMTIVLNVAGPRASQWPGGHKTAQQIVSGILRRLVDRTAPLNTVRDSPRGDP